MIICIVGKSGSGKSYICELFKKMSSEFVHLDIDKVGHLILNDENVIKNLIEVFGTSDRKSIAKIVFDSEKEMDKLTDITWKSMEVYIDSFINNNKDKIILLDWQLLPKTKYFESSDLRIYIEAPLEIRMKKTVIRDNITKDDFLLREKASYNFDNLKFDYTIINDYSDKIKMLVREIYVKSIISR